MLLYGRRVTDVVFLARLKSGVLKGESTWPLACNKCLCCTGVNLLLELVVEANVTASGSSRKIFEVNDRF